MVNAWVEHIRKFARENNRTYGCALSDPACRASYKKPPKKPTQRSERASMGGNDRPAPASVSAPAKPLRERMRVAGNRANASAYLSNRVDDARGKLEQMGMAGEDRNVAVRTFKSKGGRPKGSRNKKIKEGQIVVV